MSILQDLSNDLAAAVQTASASIVRVEARRRLAATGIVWSADGLIITSNHGVERDDSIRVGLPNGETVEATLVGRDPTTDIAVLRTSASLTAPTWVESDGIKVGHLVLALGRPEADVQATLGVVSAVSGEWRTMAGGRVDVYLQTDVVMYPGFSGGPLISSGGQILGMNSSSLARGVSLTLPAATLKRVAAALSTHGRVRRGYLGVSAQPVRLPAALAGQLSQETGLLLAAVEPDSPAKKGGLLLGDTLYSMAGQPIRQMDDLMAVLSGDRVGQTVPASVVRGGQAMDVQVTIGDRN
ncbi:MAG: trypsin-like peptidase domain-containing protein [Chloroflexi bacterium]|nr:trypsin-like peptidase domain-containing protein [Chloroflexota bacterium]